MSTIESALSPTIRGELASSTPVITVLRPTMQAAGGTTINVAAAIYREWVSLSRATTASGENVQQYLGWPIEDFTLPDGAEIVTFERGCIVLRPDSRTFAVYGTIYLHWCDLYDFKTGAGLNIGYPIGEEGAIPNGRRSRFDYADIYWNAARNAAFEVHGAIRDQWYALGGYGGFLGYPLTDESSVTKNGSEVGRYNQFEGGTIFWSGATGAFEVHGAIRDTYIDSYGGPAGQLGFPLSNETPSPSGMRRYNDFENGCIVWHADTGALDLYRSLDIFVANVNGSGSHTFWEDIGTSSVWLYANCNASTTTGFNQNFHLPPGGGDYGNPSASPGNVCTIAPVRGEMTVMLTMDGWDHCISTSDQHLGTVRLTLNVDNDFGVNQPRHLDDGDFHADVDLRRASFDNPFDTNFRRAEFWSFNNFRTPTLSRQQYAETFVDVESSESDFHWFNDLFYNEFYKGIAAGGNCFGECVESIYAERNDSLFSEPIYGVGQGTAAYEINIKQAYQLGASYLDWYAANFLAGCFWNPIRVYNEAKAAWDARDYPVICITDAARSAGHCIRPCPSPSMPYPFVDTGSQLIISVANPNAPGTNGTDAASRLVIDKATNTYSIALANGAATWTGGNFSGGIISWAPFSVLCREPRTPFWETLALALGASLIFLGSGATTVQMTDNNGKVLYKPDRLGKAQRWDDLALDDTAIPGLVRVPLYDGYLSQGPRIGVNPAILGDLLQFETDQGPELYRLVGLPSPFGKAPTQSEFVPIGPRGVAQMPEAIKGAVNGTMSVMSNVVAQAITDRATSRVGGSMVRIPLPPSSITHRIEGRGGYSWGTQSTLAAAVATISGGSGNDTVQLDRISAVDQTVTLTATDGSTRKAMLALRSRVPLAKAATSFVLENITLPSGASLTANVMPDGKTLQIQNKGDDVQLQVQVTGKDASTPMKSLPLAAGKTATLTPQDINALASTPVQVTVTSTPGGAVETTMTI